MLNRIAGLPLAKQLPPLFIFQAGARPAILDAVTSASAVRTATTSSLPNQSAQARRKSVTVVNDTGAVPWTNLSAGEKAARATQQSFNFGIVALGIVLTGGVATVLWLEVFSTDSKTAIFNKSADRVRSDPKCRELLAGDTMHSKRDINAYGEPSWSRWARNRTIASRLEKDRAGVEHLHMHFYVEGPAAKGTVNVHMSRKHGEDFEYEMLALDVPGQQRYYLEDPNKKKAPGWQGKMFGVRWN